MIKVVMFDLDGTLLPMDQETFVRAYFGGIAKKLALLKYNPDEVVYALKKSVGAMMSNNGRQTNEKVFWNVFSDVLGEDMRNHQEVFDDFYKNEFQKVKTVCGFEPRAKEVVEYVKANGFRVVLATSPMFPKVATESRIRWAGLESSDFEIYTTFEDYSYAKPSLEYYEELFKKLQVEPSECVMVGNDVLEDMVVQKLGVKVFLLKDNLINRKNQDITNFSQGGYNELFEFIKSI